MNFEPFSPAYTWMCFFWCCFVWYCATMPIVTVKKAHKPWTNHKNSNGWFYFKWPNELNPLKTLKSHNIQHRRWIRIFSGILMAITILRFANAFVCFERKKTPWITLNRRITFDTLQFHRMLKICLHFNTFMFIWTMLENLKRENAPCMFKIWQQRIKIMKTKQLNVIC